MDSKREEVRLYRREYEKMLAEAESKSPKEACGLIAGIIPDTGIKTITRVYILTNTDQSAEHFSLDPREQLAAVKDMRSRGLKPLGNWHSHPATPSRPSEEDKRLAYDRNAVYMILSLAAEEPVLNAFHVEGTEARKEHLRIVEEEV